MYNMILQIYLIVCNAFYKLITGIHGNNQRYWIYFLTVFFCPRLRLIPALCSKLQQKTVLQMSHIQDGP